MKTSLVLAAVVLSVVSSVIDGLGAADRNLLVNLINDHRQQLAHGAVKNKNGVALPKATNMYKVRYDVASEQYAQKIANGCGTQWAHRLIDLAHPGVHTPTEMVRLAVAKWISTLRTYGIGADLKFHKASPNNYYWALMAFSRDFKVGCGYKQCKNPSNPKDIQTWLVCQVGPSEIGDNVAVYTKGAPCKTNAQGATFKKSVCDVKTGLCVSP